MADSSKTYAEKTPQGGWRVAGTRVSIASIVHAYWEGRLPESIAVDYPSLSLEQIHGAIAFYLANRQDIDAYMAAQDTDWEALRSASEAKNAGLLQRLRSARARRHGGAQ